jgi:tRNA(Phe) wybutosine-synthesizing methylase Tyw3
MEMKASPDSHHTTRIVAIKECEIDEKIIAMVSWINAHSDALTLASCEGDDEAVTTEDDPDELPVVSAPYILWLCHDQFQLINIIRTIKGAETEIHWNQPRGCLVYTTRWKSKNQLEEATKLINHFGIVVE